MGVFGLRIEVIEAYVEPSAPPEDPEVLQLIEVSHVQWECAQRPSADAKDGMRWRWLRSWSLTAASLRSAAAVSCKFALAE
jgi:hypothetical protein